MPSSTHIRPIGGLFLLVVGLLLLAAGIFNETTGLSALGVIVFLAGLVLLSLRVIRRNEGL